MSETLFESLRRDAFRLNSPDGTEPSFRDCERWVAFAFSVYRKMHNIIAPYNNRQLQQKIYLPPEAERIKSAIIEEKMSDGDKALVTKMVNAACGYYGKHKGHKQLLEPHISTFHSVQFGKGQFKLEQVERSKIKELILSSNKNNKAFIPKSLVKLTITDENFGITQEFYLENVNREDLKNIGRIILRPKLGKTGIPNVKYWEVLLVKGEHRSYLIEHADSNINPRWAGVL